MGFVVSAYQCSLISFCSPLRSKWTNHRRSVFPLLPHLVDSMTMSPALSPAPIHQGVSCARPDTTCKTSNTIQLNVLGHLCSCPTVYLFHVLSGSGSGCLGEDGRWSEVWWQTLLGVCFVCLACLLMYLSQILLIGIVHWICGGWCFQKCWPTVAEQRESRGSSSHRSYKRVYPKTEQFVTSRNLSQFLSMCLVTSEAL